MKEEAELAAQFKANPVPKTNSPTYKPKFLVKEKLKDDNSMPAVYMPLRLFLNTQFWSKKNPEEIKPHC